MAARLQAQPPQTEPPVEVLHELYLYTYISLHCKTTSLVTWLVYPFGLVSIMLGQ